MAEYRRHEIVTGLFVLVSVAAFGLIAFKVGGLTFLEAFRGRRLVCVAHFADVKTLAPGARVSAAGRSVGSVVSLGLAERAIEDEELAHLSSLGARPDLRAGLVRQVVRVEFALTDPELRLDPETARVSLLQDGFLGSHFIEIEPGYWEERSAPPLLFDAGHAGGLEIASSEGGGVDRLLAAVSVSLGDVHEILEKVNRDLLSPDNSKNFSRLIGDLGDVSAKARVFLDKEETAGLHRSIVEPLRKAIEGADGLVADLRTALLDGTLPKADRFLESGQSAVTTLAGDTRSLLERTDGIVSENRADLAESVRRLRRTLWQAEMALRKIRSDPSVVLFGDDERDLEAIEVDESGLRRSGRARPYGQRDESPGGGDR